MQVAGGGWGRSLMGRPERCSQVEARPCRVQTRERKQALISAPSCSRKQTGFDLRLPRLDLCLFLSAGAPRLAARSRQARRRRYRGNPGSPRGPRGVRVLWLVPGYPVVRSSAVPLRWF